MFALLVACILVGDFLRPSAARERVKSLNLELQFPAGTKPNVGVTISPLHGRIHHATRVESRALREVTQKPSETSMVEHNGGMFESPRVVNTEPLKEDIPQRVLSALAGSVPSVAMVTFMMLLSYAVRTWRSSFQPGELRPGLDPLSLHWQRGQDFVMAAIIAKAGRSAVLEEDVAILNEMKEYSDDEDEYEELEILPVTDEVYKDEAFIVEYQKDRSEPPIQRCLKTPKSCRSLKTLPLRKNSLRWVNVTGTQNSLTRPILEAYNVHPLFVEDILNDAERSKVETLGTNELVVLFQSVNLVEPDSDDTDSSDDEDGLAVLRLEMNQVSLVLQGETAVVNGVTVERTGALLSFFNSPTKTVEQCKALIRIPNSKLRLTDSHWLLHMIMDKEVDRLFPIMNRFRLQLENVQKLLEDRGPTNPNGHDIRILRVLQSTSQEMNNLLFVLRPLASTVASLTEHARHEGMTELQWHFNDLRDHIATILDYVASMQSWARSLKDDYSYIQQDSMNRTMYLLTLITALFIPAQFLTGLFGMNFQYMPWLEWKYGYWAFWGVIAAINAFIVCAFKYIRWL